MESPTPVDWSEFYSRPRLKASRLGVPFTRASLPSINVQLSDDDSVPVHQNCNSISSVVWDTGLLVCDYILATRDSIKLGTVLDVGCGTGVVGMVAACAHAEAVVFTDNILTPSLESNLSFLSHRTTTPIQMHVLDWCHKEEIHVLQNQVFDTVVCSDIMYEETLHQPLLHLLQQLSCHRIVICFKQRYDDPEKHMLTLMSETFDIREVDISQLHCRNFTQVNASGTHLLIAYPRKKS